MLEPEPPAGTTEPGLHLVHDQERFAFVTQLAHRREVLVRCRVHAAFALHGLEHHGRHPVVERGRERVDVVEFDLPEPVGQRLERLLLLRLARGRERRERPPVERAVGGDDVEPVTTTVELSVPPRQLDRTLVRLGAGVGEEDASVAAEQGVEARRDLGLEVVVIEVRDVQQRRGLIGDRGRDFRMRVTERRHREARQEVEIARPFRIEEERALAADELDRQPAVRLHHVLGIERAHLVEADRRSSMLMSRPWCRHPPG